MANKYTRVNPVMVIATQTVELQKAILNPNGLTKNKKAILSKKVKTVETQPETKTVEPGSILWLMFFWEGKVVKNRYSSKFTAMFFFEDEPMSWNWITEDKEVFESFTSIDKIVTAL